MRWYIHGLRCKSSKTSPPGARAVAPCTDTRPQQACNRKMLPKAECMPRIPLIPRSAHVAIVRLHPAQALRWMLEMGSLSPCDLHGQHITCDSPWHAWPMTVPQLTW